MVDSREQAPYAFAGYDCEVVAGSLVTGDYSLAGLEGRAAVERKELSDLLGCLTTGRDRFERELARGRGLDLFLVVVESSWADLASGNFRSKMQPHAACQSVLTMQGRHRVPFMFCGSRAAAEYVTFWTLAKYLREAEKTAQTILKAHKEACHAV
jgi:ERCC4-type nuclease